MFLTDDQFQETAKKYDENPESFIPKSIEEEQRQAVRIEKGGTDIDVAADTVPFSEAPWYEDLARENVLVAHDAIHHKFKCIVRAGKIRRILPRVRA